MTSIEPRIRSKRPAVRATRLTRRARSARGLVAVAAFALLVTACSTAPFATHTITGTSPPQNPGTFSLGQDDNDYYTTGASCTGAFGGCATDWYGAFNDGGLVSLGGELRVVYTGKNTGAGYQFISVWNWRTSSWFPVDAFRVVATDEITVDRTLAQPGSDWIFKGIGFVRVTTIGNLASSSADVLVGCTGGCSNS